jgi:toxin-antitoxin system PIN domain toxin
VGAQVIVVDVNLLIYANDMGSPQHERARSWWERTMSGTETVGIPWIVVLGFLRITTHRRIMRQPLPPERAMEIVDSWFAQPVFQLIEPTARRWSLVKALLEPLGTAGALTSDAHLAALAIEHSALLCSTDRDFDQFEGLRWTNPLAIATGARERSRSRRQPVAARR